MKTNSCFLSAALAIASLSFTDIASAALVQTNVSTTNQTTYDGNILATDVIRNGSTSLSNVTTTGSVSTYGGNVAPFNNFDHLTDGGASTKINSDDISKNTYFDGTSLGTNPTITFTFNTTANPDGFTLTSINTISGWADSPRFSNQRYTVSLAWVGAPSTFSVLRDVTYSPFSATGNANSSQVTLTDDTGSLATGVSAIRFAFLSSGADQLFREIDVVGVASVPEPSSITLGLVGAFSLLAYRRRRQS